MGEEHEDAAAEGGLRGLGEAAQKLNAKAEEDQLRVRGLACADPSQRFLLQLRQHL